MSAARPTLPVQVKYSQRCTVFLAAAHTTACTGRRGERERERKDRYTETETQHVYREGEGVRQCG